MNLMQIKDEMMDGSKGISVLRVIHENEEEGGEREY